MSIGSRCQLLDHHQIRSSLRLYALIHNRRICLSLGLSKLLLIDRTHGLGATCGCKYILARWRGCYPLRWNTHLLLRMSLFKRWFGRRLILWTTDHKVSRCHHRCGYNKLLLAEHHARFHRHWILGASRVFERKVPMAACGRILMVASMGFIGLIFRVWLVGDARSMLFILITTHMSRYYVMMGSSVLLLLCLWRHKGRWRLLC